MKPLVALLLAAVTAVSTAACTTSSLMNVVDRPVAVRVDGSPREAEEVQAAIISACRNRGWVPRLEGESQVNCSIDVRGRHSAQIEIPFTASTFSILHGGSEGLDYNERKQSIHRNYNRWVANLALEVQRQLDTP